MPLKRAMFWKVRAMPRRVAWAGFSPVMLRPSKWTAPRCGL